MRPNALHAAEVAQEPMKMPDALRSVNVNEIKLAKTYRRLLNRRKATEKTPDAKLLLDTVRDCARILEPLREPDGLPDNAVIQLVHNVARPDLEEAPDAAVAESL